MSKKDKNNSSDILVGIAAIIALCGIGYFIITNGFDTVPSPAVIHENGVEHRSDTIKTLPIIEFKTDSITVDSLDHEK